MKKFIEIIKKKWLINGTKTFILVAIVVAIFIGINMLMQKLGLTPIDLSQDKLYTLTDESKNKVKNIDQDVNMYFVGYSDDDSTLDLAKQYKKSNEKITVEAIDVNTRPDLAQKYGIESGNEGIIIESGEKYKVLTSSDLVTYDTSTYETISVAEEKLTSAIATVTSDKIPTVYILGGYSEFTLDSNMYYFGMLLSNEIYNIGNLNLLTEGKVPDDCDTLIILTPSKDFDDIATNEIINYINSGRNILWLNAAKTKEASMPNVEKILGMYGVKPFEVGVIRETDSSKMLSGTPDIISPEIEHTTITKDIYSTTGVLFINTGRINVVNDEEMTTLNVTKTEILNASEGSYFRTNFTNQNNGASADEQTGPFLVGAELEKVVVAKEETGEEGEQTKAVTSKLVIYAENYFASDYSLSQSSQVGAIQYAYNKDLAINSIAYLVDREEDIVARKNTGTVTYTATEQQNTIIQIIIFAVPALIILIGIIVWQVRRRKK